MPRPVLIPLCVALACGPLAAQGGPSAPIVMTLLGTGTPNPRIDRMGPSTLIEAGGLRLLFDVGRGTTIRLAQAGIRAADITAVFFTHLHSDHTNGVPDLWLTGWLPPLGGRRTALRLFGPRGTRTMAQGLAAAFAEDIRMRTTEERLPPSGVVLDAHEFETDGTVFDEAGVRVTAFSVDHGGELRPAYGFRVSSGRRSVVISGDTRFSDNLIRHATGADVVLHEVISAPAETHDDPSVAFRLSHHTSAGEAGRVFQQTKPRLGLLTHIALVPDRQGRMSTPAEIVAEAANAFTGRIEVGEDLMRVTIGDTIAVERPSSR